MGSEFFFGGDFGSFFATAPRATWKRHGCPSFFVCCTGWKQHQWSKKARLLHHATSCLGDQFHLVEALCALRLSVTISPQMNSSRCWNSSPVPPTPLVAGDPAERGRRDVAHPARNQQNVWRRRTESRWLMYGVTKNGGGYLRDTPLLVDIDRSSFADGHFGATPVCLTCYGYATVIYPPEKTEPKHGARKIIFPVDMVSLGSHMVPCFFFGLGNRCGDVWYGTDVFLSLFCFHVFFLNIRWYGYHLWSVLASLFAISVKSRNYFLHR